MLVLILVPSDKANKFATIVAFHRVTEFSGCANLWCLFVCHLIKYDHGAFELLFTQFFFCFSAWKIIIHYDLSSQNPIHFNAFSIFNVLTAAFTPSTARTLRTDVNTKQNINLSIQTSLNPMWLQSRVRIISIKHCM